MKAEPLTEADQVTGAGVKQLAEDREQAAIAVFNDETMPEGATGQALAGFIQTAGRDRSALWLAGRLAMGKGKKAPLPTFANAVRVLEFIHAACKGGLWRDLLQDATYTEWFGTAEAWTDEHTREVLYIMQDTVGLQVGMTVVADAVELVAARHAVHPLQDYLNGLEWDRVPRLEQFLHKGFGAEDNTYTRAVGRCFLTGAVARALRPGCKMDNMLVLESTQGLKKSTAVAALAGDPAWFAETNAHIGTDKFKEVLLGKWFVEIAELESMNKAEAAAIKQALTCQRDTFRRAYRRNKADYPRTCVLVGTGNVSDWARDATGGRRFWPVTCTAVDIAWLTDNRDQLFAEAVAGFKAGKSWWDVPENEAKAEQSARYQSDAWEEIVATWLEDQDWALAEREGKGVSAATILSRALGLSADRMGRAEQNRLGAVMRRLGYVSKVTRIGHGVARRWHKGEATEDGTPESRAPTAL